MLIVMCLSCCGEPRGKIYPLEGASFDKHDYTLLIVLSHGHKGLEKKYYAVQDDTLLQRSAKDVCVHILGNPQNRTSSDISGWIVVLEDHNEHLAIKYTPANIAWDGDEVALQTDEDYAIVEYGPLEAEFIHLTPLQVAEVFGMDPDTLALTLIK